MSPDDRYPWSSARIAYLRLMNVTARDRVELRDPRILWTGEYVDQESQIEINRPYDPRYDYASPIRMWRA